MKIVVAIFISLSSPMAAKAKLVEVKYSTISCSCRAEIDSSIISAKHVKNAMALVVRPTLDLDIPELKKVKPDLSQAKSEVSSRLKNTITKLRTAKLPGTSNWEKVRQFYIRDAQLSAYLKLASLDFLVGNNTSRLFEPFNKSPVPPKCTTFANALKNRIGIYEKYVELKQHHGNDACMSQKEFVVALKSNTTTANFEGCIQYMRGQIFFYGWQNCVNQAWRLNEAPEKATALQEVNTLLKNKRCDCESP